MQYVRHSSEIKEKMMILKIMDHYNGSVWRLMSDADFDNAMMHLESEISISVELFNAGIRRWVNFNDAMVYMSALRPCARQLPGRFGESMQQIAVHFAWEDHRRAFYDAFLVDGQLALSLIHI